MTKHTNPVPFEDLPYAAAQLMDALMEDNRRIHAVERLALATACLAVSRSDDPLAYCDQLRKVALDPLPLEGVGAGVREHLELLLGKLEVAAGGMHPPGGG